MSKTTSLGSVFGRIRVGREVKTEASLRDHQTMLGNRKWAIG
uniref:Transposase n=1 Tax=Mesocestoides corti TaxID=53468 RepID=A0A5K3FKI4_MESCO